MRKRTKRMLSVLMAALMVVSIMPVTGSNNIVAKASTASAESSVVTWSAADILADSEFAGNSRISRRDPAVPSPLTRLRQSRRWHFSCF